MQKKPRTFAELKVAIGGYPCGTRVAIELAPEAKPMKAYKVWASFAKRPETYLGVIAATHLG